MQTAKKIFITGGHLTPALATADLLLAKGWQIYYIGRKYSQEEDNSVSMEYKIIKSYQNKIKLLIITTGKLQRYFNLKSILSLFKIPLGLAQSIYWLIKYRPGLVLSFGGYVALPVSFGAWLFNIPIVTHEQTRVIGLANKIINFIADKVCISWLEKDGDLPSKKFIYTGLPLRKAVFSVRDSLPIDINKPVLYVSGGSLGSHIINTLLEPLIPKLVKEFTIIHQCGDTQRYSDYQRLTELRDNLPNEVKDRYLPIKYVPENQIGWLYKKVSFALSRSGANTVYEFAAIGIPALFIPIPFAAGNEQTINAQFFQENKAGKLIQEQKLTSEKLYQEISEFKQRIDQYKINAQELKKKILRNGADNLMKVIDTLTKPHN